MSIKNFINVLLRNLTGYQLSKFDGRPYTFRKKLTDFLEKNVGEGKILDIGSVSWNYPKERFGKARVTTIDLQPGADVLGDVTKLPFPDYSFDTVICLETMEHVKDPFKAVQEIERVLAPGGKFIGSAPFNHELHGEEYGDYWRFTRQGWIELLQNFKNVSIEPYAGKNRAPGWYLVTGEKKK